jgi:hypothetical protein
MNEMPATREAMSGAARRARAMLVSGPVGTNHTPSFPRTVSMMKPTASRLAGGPDGSGKLGAVEPALAVHVAGGELRSDQRPAGAGVDGDVDAQQVAQHDCIPGRRLERCVAGNGGDPEQIRVAGGNDQRDGVVVTWIAIEEDGQALCGCHDRQSMPPLPS